MMEQFFPFIPAVGVFFGVLGLYKLTLDKQSRAQQRIVTAVSEARRPSDLMDEDNMMDVLKKPMHARNGLFAFIENRLEHANWALSLVEFMLLCAGTGLFFALLLLGFSHNLGLALLAGVAGTAFPFLYLQYKLWRRNKLAAEQFADVLETMVSCFKSGYGLKRALQLVSEKYHDPWGTEFEKIINELNLGASLERALTNLYQRMHTPDVELFVSALLIQKESGGNLGEVLSNLSNTCRKRYDFFRMVNTISAQGRLSALIVSCIPFLLMLMMYAMLPKAAMEFVTNPIGAMVLLIVGIWMCFGYSVLYKIVQIEV